MRRSHAGAGWSLLLVTVAAAGCEVSSEGPRDREDAVESPRTMMPQDEADSIAREMARAVTATVGEGARAATTMPALFASNAILSDETEQTYSGNAAIRGAFAQGMPPGASITIQSESVIGSGDLVVDMGRYTVEMPGPQGAAMRMNGRYLVVLQRMSDDSWKIVRQLTDATGMGGALPSGPPPSVARDSASVGDTSAAPRRESGFTGTP